MRTVKEPAIQAIGEMGIAFLASIAKRSAPDVAARRLRQLHELNPGTWHTTNATTPDTCPHCTDEETRP